MTRPVPQPSPAYREFDIVENGLSYTVRVTQAPDGSFSATITVIEGAADFNALYFGDAVDDGSSAALKGNLNMNGRGDPDWDGAIKLSDPGLGKAGAAKPTYLEAGESFTFKLPGVDSFDDITTIGVRATSTSTPEGSIKSVAVHDGDDDGGDDGGDGGDTGGGDGGDTGGGGGDGGGDTGGGGGDTGNPDTYVANPGGGISTRVADQPVEAQAEDEPASAAEDDPAPQDNPFEAMSGEDLFLALADAMGEVPEDAPPEDAPEDEAEAAPIF